MQDLKQTPHNGVIWGSIIGVTKGDSRSLEYSPSLVRRMWLWVYYNKVPIYPIFYLRKGDYVAYSVYDCRSGA